MDRLDAQAARRFDRAGEKLAGAGQALGRQVKFAQFHQIAAQVIVGLHRPLTQPLEQAVLHLGRGGLGIGQAQHVLRFDPVQQQACHPVGQDAGLAGTGIRRKPGVAFRMRRLGLGQKGRSDGHARSSGVTAAVSSHSPKRDRWS